MSQLSTVVIGDVFVPGTLLADAIRTRLGPDFGPISVFDWSVEGGPNALHAQQHQIELHGPDAVALPDELIEAVSKAELLVVHFAPICSDLIQTAPRLQAVFAARAGTENIASEAARLRGIDVRGVKGRNAIAVAEMTLALSLAEMRNIVRAHRSIADGGWRKEFSSRPRELTGATVGLVGYGAVARRFVRLLTGLDTSIIAYDPFTDPRVLAEDGVLAVSLEEVFSRSDLVTVFARLTEENTRFISSQLFSSMRPGSYFVNTARSRLVDYDALYEALVHGPLAGAALDVFDEEPLPSESPWRSLDNVTLTSHFAGDTPASFQRSGALIAEQIADFLKNEQAAAR